MPPSISQQPIQIGEGVICVKSGASVRCRKCMHARVHEYGFTCRLPCGCRVEDVACVRVPLGEG